MTVGHPTEHLSKNGSFTPSRRSILIFNFKVLFETNLNYYCITNPPHLVVIPKHAVSGCIPSPVVREVATLDRDRAARCVKQLWSIKI